MKNLDKRLIGYLSISFIIVYSIIFFIQNNYKDRLLNDALNEEIKNIKVHFDLTTRQFNIDIKNAHLKTIRNKKVLDIFAKAYKANKDEQKILRKQLQVLLNPWYKRLKNRGVFQFHFVFPNNVTFLRMHKPSKFGDDLSDIRYSFNYVNKNKKPINGFEQGKTSHGFRYITPLFKGDKYIGAVDISFGTEIFQESLLNISKIKSRFLVKKDVFNAKAWERDDHKYNYKQSIEHKDYLFTPTLRGVIDIEAIQKERSQIIFKIKDEIDKNINLNKPFSLYVDINCKVKTVTFLPIKNIKEKTVIAYLVAYKCNQNIKNILKDSEFFKVIIFTTLFLLFLFIYKIKTEKRVLQKEVEEQLKTLRKKDNILIHQSRLASMGEMIGNIAHQWRQPLNLLGIKLMTLDMYYKSGKIDDKFMEEYAKDTSNTIQHMSDTIDDFRDFFKPDKEKEIFNISNEIRRTVDIVKDSFINHNITCVINNGDNITIDGYKNEFSQVILNLISNAKDALKQNNTKDAKITINISLLENNIVVEVRDNAGGIPDDIIDKVFEPYFTTKYKSQGTGIGLYMSKMIIENNMGGELSVRNDKEGAVFSIRLKINELNKNE